MRGWVFFLISPSVWYTARRRGSSLTRPLPPSGTWFSLSLYLGNKNHAGEKLTKCVSVCKHKKERVQLWGNVLFFLSYLTTHHLNVSGRARERETLCASLLLQALALSHFCLIIISSHPLLLLLHSFPLPSPCFYYEKLCVCVPYLAHLPPSKKNNTIYTCVAR